MLCGILATSFFLTGCEENEVKKTSQETEREMVLRKFHEQFPIENDSNEAGRTQAPIALDIIFDATLIEPSKYQLQGDIDHPNCYSDNITKHTTKWYWWDSDTQVWTLWTTKSASCVGNTNATKDFTSTSPSHIWIFARVKISNNPNVVWGEGLSTHSIFI